MRNDLQAFALAGEETIPHEQAPIFTHLVALWIGYGRTVPGHVDQEWHRLVQPPRFAPPALGTTGPAGQPE
ncbi:hypothetical protein ABT263_14715 [Kitasatospora sp. NPDC001603]|uniref:hypothetical protein n=1 Tax=Kitasatospora sp. NPDC001603 TaxID=3154388 RepID=UPI00332B28D7